VFDPLIPVYQRKVGRRGVPPDAAARRVGNRPTVAAALLLEAGMADACLCGRHGDWLSHWHHAYDVIGKQDRSRAVYALSALILPTGTCSSWTPT
jgi:malate dehydrogenase (oxaloacetate-decarboxylating)(NADP+)